MTSLNSNTTAPVDFVRLVDRHCAENSESSREEALAEILSNPAIRDEWKRQGAVLKEQNQMASDFSSVVAEYMREHSGISKSQAWSECVKAHPEIHKAWVSQIKTEQPSAQPTGLDFDALVKQETAVNGRDRRAAIRTVAKSNPEVHKAWISKVNDGKPLNY